MREYRFSRQIFLFIVIGYVFASFYGPRLGRAEFYPFFKWSLFSYTHSTRFDVVVLVHSINGIPLKKPTLYYYVPEKFVNHSSQLRKVLGDFMNARSKSNQQRMDKLLDIINSKFFSGVKTAEYEIAVIEYNPIERLKTGQFESRTILRISK